MHLYPEFLKKDNNEDEPEAVHKARKLFSLCKDTGKTNDTGSSKNSTK